jgi:hypothetical protein
VPAFAPCRPVGDEHTPGPANDVVFPDVRRALSPYRDRMPCFVVERYLAGWSPEQIHQLVDRIVSSGDAFARHHVSHVRSLVLPGDETCLCIFDGPDADTVARANAALALPVDRVGPAELAPSAPP